MPAEYYAGLRDHAGSEAVAWNHNRTVCTECYEFRADCPTICPYLPEERPLWILCGCNQPTGRATLGEVERNPALYCEFIEKHGFFPEVSDVPF
jgi:hypothetical protein